MKMWMKNTIAATMIATVGLTVAGAAMARGDCERGGPRGERAAWHQMTPEKMQERAGAKLEQLEEKLAIRDDQRSAWDTYKQSMLERSGEAAERMKEMHGGERPATALERMQRMEEAGQARLQAMGEMRKATEALYSVLDETQKTAFDEQHRSGRHAHGERGHRGEKGSARSS